MIFNKKQVKRIVYTLIKIPGIFKIIDKTSKRNIKILCYHNFSTGAELKFRPKLFIHPDQFEKRMKFLKENEFNVISLDDAIDYLNNGNIPDKAIVITMDDGWYNTYRYAHPILLKYQFPYTVYIFSYYSKMQQPVFNVSLAYIFWLGKNKDKALGYLKSVTGYNGSFGDQSNREYQKLIDYATERFSLDQLNDLTRKLSDILGVNLKETEKERRFYLVNDSEITRMSHEGVDIQLHTNLHHWPLNRKDALKEIYENQRYLEPLIGKKLYHFCYPSGYWQKQQLSYLSEAKIKSAVTCEPGNNYTHTNRLLLKRFLDGEDISQIEYEAEVYGVGELARKCRFTSKDQHLSNMQ